MPMSAADRVSSHIPSFDAVTAGGFTPGSSVLLLSEYGAGGREFILTSIANRIHFYRSLKGGVRYVSSRVDEATFTQQMMQMFQLSRDEISSVQFQDGVSGEKAEDVQMVYVDSLTRFLSPLGDSSKWYDALDAFYEHAGDMRRRKRVSVFLLAAGVLSKQHEEELKDCFDAVFSFQWVSGASRSREMHVEKYDGLPWLAAPKAYHVRILPESGFEISNLRRIQ